MEWDSVHEVATQEGLVESSTRSLAWLLWKEQKLIQEWWWWTSPQAPCGFNINATSNFVPDGPPALKSSGGWVGQETRREEKQEHFWLSLPGKFAFVILKEIHNLEAGTGKGGGEEGMMCGQTGNRMQNVRLVEIMGKHAIGFQILDKQWIKEHSGSPALMVRLCHLGLPTSRYCLEISWNYSRPPDYRDLLQKYNSSLEYRDRSPWSTIPHWGSPFPQIFTLPRFHSWNHQEFLRLELATPGTF